MDISKLTMLKCSHCPYKTPLEESMNRHILARECPNGSYSYKEVK